MLFPEVEKLAKKTDKTLTATNFSNTKMVEVRHDDGSHLYFHNAFILMPDQWVIVFTEHHGYHIYDQSEVSIRLWQTSFDYDKATNGD